MDAGDEKGEGEQKETFDIMGPFWKNRTD